MTPTHVRFTPAAVEDAEEAYRWYRARSPSAATAFLAELDQAIVAIGAAPERPAPYLHGTRRVRFRRFPFAVIYRPVGVEIEVIAVAHGRRRPGYWRDR